IWNVLDVTPEGRGNQPNFPALRYAHWSQRRQSPSGGSSKRGSMNCAGGRWIVRPARGRSSMRQRRASGTPSLERIDMAKFIYLYRGPTPDLTPEQGAERMAAFTAWMEKLGPALTDGGSPFGASASVRDDGTEATAGELIG